MSKRVCQGSMYGDMSKEIGGIPSEYAKGVCLGICLRRLGECQDGKSSKEFLWDK